MNVQGLQEFRDSGWLLGFILMYGRLRRSIGGLGMRLIFHVYPLILIYPIAFGIPTLAIPHI
jgi:hypothetical protein